MAAQNFPQKWVIKDANTRVAGTIGYELLSKPKRRSRKKYKKFSALASEIAGKRRGGKR